jgi:hypothetical protein
MQQPAAAADIVWVPAATVADAYEGRGSSTTVARQLCKARDTRSTRSEFPQPGADEGVNDGTFAAKASGRCTLLFLARYSHSTGY